MKRLRALCSLLVIAVLFWALNRPHGILPPLGKLLNPFAGFWQNNEAQDKIPQTLDLPELQSTARVVWDERRVPHIFAENDHDVFFAQGYITARDRLWQMEFQTLFAAGRLSEIVGEKALEQDRFQRRIGMVYAAENFLKGLEGNLEAQALLQAYTDGVNAFIRSLRPKEFPVEYKILDYAPEPWTNLKTAFLLKYLAWDLTGYSTDWKLTRARENLGDALMEQLYPFYPPFMDPIIPPATQWEFVPLVPQYPERENAPRIQEPSGIQAPEDIKGSNNWAVSGKKTRSGFPMLCNDPHLALRLPAIWYEIQLSAPGVNTYGVSLPGAPGVIIGFNEKIAWGMTNAGSDVLDWYKIAFKDASREEYLYDGAWHKTKFRFEEIKIRGRKSVIDKVCYTHHGPVVSQAGEESRNGQIPQGTAMRWAAHDPSQTLLTFYLLNRAKNYEDFLAAIRNYDCPAMNFVYADADGNIAIWHDGKYPLRPKGQGRFILDGTLPADEWTEWIPWEHLPHVKNPGRGFVSSANQNAADLSYPYYLGWDYASFERGARINELLTASSDLSPKDMIKMQNDSLNVRAKMALPRLLSFIDKKVLTDEEKMSLEELRNWDFIYGAGSAAPTIFNSFWPEISDRIWKDDLTRGKETFLMPRSDVTLNLILSEPESPFIDDKTTPERETLSDLAVQAFQATHQKLQKNLGPFGPAWAWGKARGTEIRHLARIPGFGTPSLETDGGTGIINATSQDFGPSWKMTVALGPNVKAWGIYPGGQSGNPGSGFYDNAVKDWVTGRAYEILYLASPDEKNLRVIGKSELRGGR